MAKNVAKQMNKLFYFRYDTIIPWMEKLATDNPSFITLTNMGRLDTMYFSRELLFICSSSHEDRKILMLKVGNSPRGSDTRAVWVDGGIHARYSLQG